VGVGDEIIKLKEKLDQLHGLRRQEPAGRLHGSRWQAHIGHIEAVVHPGVLFAAKNAALEFCPAILRLANAFQYNVSDDSLSFDYSPDFDFDDEPMLAASFTFHTDGMYQFIPVSEDPVIWMHKWLWVTDDYKGFDVLASMRRSLTLCERIPVEEQKRFHRRTAWLERLNSL
jgi:hypothetical protein